MTNSPFVDFHVDDYEVAAAEHAKGHATEKNITASNNSCDFFFLGACPFADSVGRGLCSVFVEVKYFCVQLKMPRYI